MTDNVLAFPKEKIVREGFLFETESMKKAYHQSVINHADGIVSEIADAIAGISADYGIDTDDFNSNITYVMCAISASVYAALEIEHPLHQYIHEAQKVIEKELQEIDVLE